MKFKLKPHSKNLFPKGAILIKDESPRIWLKEIQKMGFNLDDIAVYPIPSSVPNQLHGCLLVYNPSLKIRDIGKNSYFQSIKNKLFIPENTILSPTFSLEELGTVFSEYPYAYHIDFGLVELNEPVNWMDIIIDFKERFPLITAPLQGIAIPRFITSLRVEIDEEKIIRQLEHPITEQDALENLPFDMKKVLKGNQKEIDKYLDFLDKNPEMALKYAIPLDVLNTSRGNLKGQFRFQKTFGDGFRNFLGKRKMPKSFNGSGSGGGGMFSGAGNDEPWITSDTVKLIFRIFVMLVIASRALSVSSGVFLGILKVLFFGGIAIGFLYLIYNFFRMREERSFNEPSTYSTNTYGAVRNLNEITYHPSGNFNTSTGARKTDIYKSLPVAVMAVILVMSYLFVKFITSEHVDTSVSPFFYIMGLLILLFIIIFIIVKLFDKVDRSLRADNLNGGDSVLLDNDRFSILKVRYEKLAQDFIDNKEYAKASHVYRNLLQNNYAAAEVLEQGDLYQEAAVTYLKFCQNKEKAAECYEKGRSYKEAIVLYKELDEKEKVGDLYLLIDEKKEANKYFYKVVEEYKEHFQYVKASLILRNKVKDTTKAQGMLLEGWRTNKDASNCLNNYFANVTEVNELQNEIRDIYKHETNESNLESFLQLLKIEFKKEEALETLTRDIAYEIIASKIEKKPDISTELLHFNKSNPSISKDIMKFKLNSRKGN
jgi:tetratricopeptide (TPR) repeat protein